MKCPSCGGAELIVDTRDIRYVSPDYIAQIRKKLHLDQKEAAESFGGGVNAFSRHENGKTLPPLALVKLLKVLGRHPELLNEVRSGQ